MKEDQKKQIKSMFDGIAEASITACNNLGIEERTELFKYVISQINEVKRKVYSQLRKLRIAKNRKIAKELEKASRKSKD